MKDPKDMTEAEIDREVFHQDISEERKTALMIEWRQRLDNAPADLSSLSEGR